MRENGATASSAAVRGACIDEFISKDDVLDFLNAKGCRIIFRRFKQPPPQADGTVTITRGIRETLRRSSQLYLIDYCEDRPKINPVSDLRGFAPFFSSDGEKIVYNLSFHPTDIYVQWIDNRCEPIAIGYGANPTWWTDPGTGEEYVVYRTVNGKLYWPHPGATMRQRIDRKTGEAVGKPVQILDNGFGGGLSRDGRYVSTGFITFDIVDLWTGDHRVLMNGERVCNVTMAPDDSQRIMSLRTDHRYFGTIGVDDSDDTLYKAPDHLFEWQTPKWTNHPDYAILVGATSELLYHIYAYRLSDRSYKRIVWGDTYIHAHLWIDF